MIKGYPNPIYSYNSHTIKKVGDYGFSLYILLKTALEDTEIK